MPLAHRDLEPTIRRTHIPLVKDSETRRGVQLTHFIGCTQSHLAQGGSSQCLAVTRACAAKGDKTVLGCQDHSQCVPGLVGGHKRLSCGLQLWPEQRHQNGSPQKVLRLLRQSDSGSSKPELPVCHSECQSTSAWDSEPRAFPLSTCDS